MSAFENVSGQNFIEEVPQILNRINKNLEDISNVVIAFRNLKEQFQRTEFDFNQLECTSSTCGFNHDGECRFALVHGRKSMITEDDDCLDYVFAPTA